MLSTLFSNITNLLAKLRPELTHHEGIGNDRRPNLRGEVSHLSLFASLEIIF